ncbi:MAG: hypothetical protein HOW59_10555 [Nonomuraea sp.]|nr:hypothetical protein [Nonomuraea sp.]
MAPAAGLQLAFAIPNFLIQEQSVGLHYDQDNDVLDHLLDPGPLTFTGGRATRHPRPGPGVEIDEAAVERAAELGHRWRGPSWRHEDGSFDRVVIPGAADPDSSR